MAHGVNQIVVVLFTYITLYNSCFGHISRRGLKEDNDNEEDRMLNTQDLNSIKAVLKPRKALVPLKTPRNQEKRVFLSLIS